MHSGLLDSRIILRLFVILFVGVAGGIGLCPRPLSAQVNISIDLEEAPFEYSQTAAENPVSRLIEGLDAKTVRLEYTRETGYLRSVLKALGIPESSQVLVFSKTSMQVQAISRRNPRAIYFNDDTYVGWIRGSSLMEISTADPKLGTAFYTVDMMPWRAKIKQAHYDCLACHATSMTQGVPGHTVRSVHPEVDGSVASQRESYITDHSSPFSQRWGGWYVTGRHGEMRHMGNTFLRGGQLDLQDNGNRLSLWDEFDTHDYLSPYSDIVALMVLEHQTQMHNAITQADFAVRQMMHERDADENRKEDPDEWNARLHLIAKPVVDYALFCDETPLTDPVKGSVIFADEFTRRGPVDRRGRSLRDFDLTTRMFKYPCSYLVYSPAFDAMQQSLKREFTRQLLAVLTGANQDAAYRHLDAQTRADTLEILRETKPEWFK